MWKGRMSSFAEMDLLSGMCPLLELLWGWVLPGHPLAIILGLAQSLCS